MKRTITTQQKQAMAQARVKKAATRARVISVAGWRLFRADEHNIVLERDGDTEASETRGYYPDVPSALRALYRRINDPARKSELADVLTQMRAAEERIVAAFAASGAADLFSMAAEPV